MRAVRTIRGLAAPLLLPDVDTDVITPMRRIMVTRREDLGRWAFEPLRYLPGTATDAGTAPSENPDFVLNQPPWRDARILLAGPNFGCGSSRETAVWAIQQMGFEAVVAPSFGDIFHNNCLQSGLLPIVLGRVEVAACAAQARRTPTDAQAFVIDLEQQVLQCPDGTTFTFAINAWRKQALLQGLDDIGMTLARSADIEAFEQDYARRRPFLAPALPTLLPSAQG
jgi:3-isopropylmalate/(R)-2-methylmalate dehydratase small subunit